ncbi:NAD-dependent epimerase/dehydratase [Legionella birminghamensis]|uniref:NAD-dependent epimerase/dehydratase n=1 Tax=Legionella birminghamensis TaxID=28083 RepID=A0A378IDM8_9GAMM|nr:NAD-dependent epimerase/dehydratase family protein [Legionella birminghamensis]KTC70208.1 NAD-dependent epimerase/dehydratase [Legionella birminghamensis]STX30384.1 NAD-dependent epimerase/dehydratase [Legionella birminghamensis]
MAILITGGAGFIGSNLVELLLGLNQEVIVIDDLSTGTLRNIEPFLANKNFKFYQSNLLEIPLDPIVQKCEIIFHLAAIVGMFNVLQKPIATLEVNMQSTERLLMAVSRLQQKPVVLVASSSEVYGSKHTAMKETNHLHIEASGKAHASYPVSKLCNEVAGMAYYHEMQVPVIVMRIFNTVGRRQSSRYGMVLPRFIKQAIHGEPITIFGDGSQTRSFCDVRDTCQIMRELSLTPKAIGEIVNVGSDHSISIIELAELVRQLAESASELHYQSFEETYGDGYINIQNRKPELSKLRSLINYRHHWTLEKTIIEMIEHAR